MEFIELEKIYRQQDERFISLLNSIRNKTTTDEDIALLNQRVNPDYIPEEYYICLTPKNVEAGAINEERLDQLKGKMHTFDAHIKGSFGREYYPTKPTLNLKRGSQVMMINNDNRHRWVNGTMGKVLRFERDEDEVVVVVELEDGHEVDRSDLVGEYIGQTAPKVKEAIKKAAGGILFIDEAYALARNKDDGKDYGREVIEILIKEMSDGTNGIAVLVAGYPEEMRTFLESNPGLKSRFKDRKSVV